MARKKENGVLLNRGWLLALGLFSSTGSIYLFWGCAGGKKRFGASRFSLFLLPRRPLSERGQ